jgi:hypothetical protein
MTPGLPYAHLNLRTNPFCQPTPEERPRLAVVELEGWVDLVRGALGGRRAGESGAGVSDAPRRFFSRGRSGRARPFVLQLLGPAGCGKTTHLDALHRHFPSAPHVAWSALHGWPAMGAGDPLFLDDAHALPERRWRSVLARRALVVATQRDLTGTLGRVAPECRLQTVRIVGRITPDHVRRLLDDRLEWARRGPGPVPKIGADAIVSLLSRHGSDLRALYDELYRFIQNHPPVTP